MARFPVLRSPDQRDFEKETNAGTVWAKKASGPEPKNLSRPSARGVTDTVWAERADWTPVRRQYRGDDVDELGS